MNSYPISIRENTEPDPELLDGLAGVMLRHIEMLHHIANAIEKQDFNGLAEEIRAHLSLLERDAMVLRIAGVMKRSG